MVLDSCRQGAIRYSIYIFFSKFDPKSKGLASSRGVINLKEGSVFCVEIIEVLSSPESTLANGSSFGRMHSY